MSLAKLQRGAGDVAAEVEMSRMNWAGSFLLVEGPSDERFWKTRRNARCEVVVATGRAQVLGALEILNQRNTCGVLGIVDDDLDEASGTALPLRNAVALTPMDLESMLIQSGALGHVLAEFGNEQKISKFVLSEGMPIRDALYGRVTLFAKLRWIHRRDGNRSSLDSLKPKRFCDVQTWSYDEVAIKTEGVRLGLAASVEELDVKLGSLPRIEEYRVCRGHDLVDVLVGGLMHRIGDGSISRDALCAVLRTSYQHAELRASKAWASICSWESGNSPYMIVAESVRAS